MARVLVVDDDLSVRAVLERILTRDSHEVAVAGTGREALNLLDQSAFDLLLTDIHMPDMDGIELILAVRERERSIPVIAISGGGRVDPRALLGDAQAFGAVDVVQKPFRVNEIQAVLRKHLPEPTS